MTHFSSALVVNTCHTNDILTQREFVWPIVRSLPIPSRTLHLRALTPRQIGNVDMVVLSGCQLEDNAYLKLAPKLKWLRDVEKPILGICAGQHLLSLAYGGKRMNAKTAAIGVEKVKQVGILFLLKNLPDVFSVYSLHGNLASVPKGFDAIAKSKGNPNEIMVHRTKPVAGISFHPEVLNKHLFTDFVHWAEAHGVLARAIRGRK